MAEALLEFETLNADEIRVLFKTGKVERPNLSEPAMVADMIHRPSGEKRRKHRQSNVIYVDV